MKKKRSKYYAIAAVVLIIVSLAFLSPKITGNATASLSGISSTWIGGVLFLAGIVFGFVYLRKVMKLYE